MMFSHCSCGQAPSHSERVEVGEFQDYVTRFEATAAQYGMQLKVTDLVIRYGKLENPKERGVCEIVEGETPTITINETRWAQLEDLDREILLFHEMGHCVLRRIHRNKFDKYGDPESMMHAYALDRGTYMKNENYYLAELFSHSNDI